MWITVIALVAAALVVAAAYFVYKLAFGKENGHREDVYALPPGKQQAAYAQEIYDNITQLLKQPFEQVSITSWDGTKLCGRYYHRKNGAPLQIQFHGYRGNAIREFAGTFRMAQALEINSLVVDMRAHGNSGGRCITLGLWESEDCLCWAEYAYQRFGRHTPVVLTGASMGATTVLLASALPLPENVKCVVADSPFSSTKGIIRKVCRIARIPFWVGYPLAVLGAALFGRFPLGRGSALKAVATAKVPLLLIHGDADRFVPCEMSRQLHRACAGDKRLYIVPNAGHCLSYYADAEGYLRELKNFFVQYGVFEQDKL